jgi:hypothetical protein
MVGLRIMARAIAMRCFCLAEGESVIQGDQK